jgi:hypothetical protein
MAIAFETFTVTPVSAVFARDTPIVGVMAQVIPEDDPVCITEKEPPATNVCAPGFKKAGLPSVFVMVKVIGLDATPFGL